MRLQEVLDYISTALIVLGGIAPLAIASNMNLPTWASFAIGLLVITLSALQKQYQRKLERVAVAQPSPEQARAIEVKDTRIERLEVVVGELTSYLHASRPPAVPAPPREGE